MTQIVLTPEQSAILATATGPVVVLNDRGQTVLQIAALPAKADSAGTDLYPSYCKTEEDRQRYLASVNRLPTYEELVKACIEPPAEWKEEKWDR
jgi:hypothetical protein